MDRFTLAALLVALLPKLAPAQRVEVAGLLGVYQPIPLRLPTVLPYDCERPDDCWDSRETRSMGTVIGGRLTIHLRGHLGVDATIYRTRSTNYWRSTNLFADGTRFQHHDASVTFFALQPHGRLRLSGAIETTIAVGPTLVAWDPDPSSGAARGIVAGGLAFSAGLRGQIAPPVTFELQFSHTHLTGRDMQRNRNHLVGAVGFAFALLR